MKYAALTANQAYFPVAQMCRALEVSRSGIYAVRAAKHQCPGQA